MLPFEPILRLTNTLADQSSLPLFLPLKLILITIFVNFLSFIPSILKPSIGELLASLSYIRVFAFVSR